MRCPEFREHHCAFVDDTLAGVELVRMQRHVAECTDCAELDTRVRRSLMWVRNLPNIEPSADFSRKLEAKLRACRAERGGDGGYGNFRAVAVAGAVASLLMLGYMAESLHVERLAASRPVARDVVMHPVVAMASLTPAAPSVAGSDAAKSRVRGAGAGDRRQGRRDAEIVAVSGQGAVPVGNGTGVAPEIIASVSAGMPLWPAALFAEQAPIHFVSYRKPVH